MKVKKVKCKRCGNYVKADELTDISLCNGPCWIDICPLCELIVQQEILDIFENNTDVTGYYTDPTMTKQVNPQYQITDFGGE